MPISVHFPNSRSPALIMITRRTADEESVAMTMNKNKNIVDVILGKMVPRVSMMLIGVCKLSLAEMRNFVYRTGQLLLIRDRLFVFCVLYLTNKEA